MTEETQVPSPQDRKVKLRVALEEVLGAAGAAGGDPYDGTFSWPLMLVDAVLKSESTGDPAAQDRLIEAIGVLLGVGVDESLTIPKAASRLNGDGARGYLIASLERQQAKAEEKAAVAARDCDEGQSGYSSGLIEAFAFAIGLVNLSNLPSDNDQQIGELITVDDAKLLIDLFCAVPKGTLKILDETGHELPALLDRMKKLVANA